MLYSMMSGWKSLTIAILFKNIFEQKKLQNSIFIFIRHRYLYAVGLPILKVVPHKSRRTPDVWPPDNAKSRLSKPSTSNKIPYKKKDHQSIRPLNNKIIYWNSSHHNPTTKFLWFSDLGELWPLHLCNSALSQSVCILKKRKKGN